jgi:hypothetical protein
VEGVSLFRAAKLYIESATGGVDWESERREGAGPRDPTHTEDHQIDALERIVKMVERTRAELLLDSWEEDESEERDDSASPSKADKGARSRKSLADVIETIGEWLENDHDRDDNNNSADESIVNDRTEVVYRLKQEATRFETRRRLDTEVYTSR